MSDGTRLVTGRGLCSYPALFIPKAIEVGGPLKYSVSILFDKVKDKAIIAQLQKAHDIALVNGKEKFTGYNPRGKKFFNPIMDGDAEKPEDDVYAGKMYITAKSDRPPGVFDAQRNAITDHSDIYAGCFIRASINFFPFEKGSQGVACGLESVQKLSDGTPIGAGGKPTADVFDDGYEDDIPDDDYDDI